MAKRANGEGTISKRKNKNGTISWEAKITINGKRRSFYGRSQEVVKEKLDKARSELRNNSFIEPSDMSIKNWLEIWIDTYTTHIKDSTRNEYRKIIEQRILPRLGDKKLQKLSQDDVQRFINELFKSGRVNRKDAPAGLSARSVEFTHTVLCAAMSQAESIGHIQKNPAVKKKPNRSGGITLPKVISKDVEILSGESLNAFEIAVQEHEHKALFLTLLWTGLRRGECLALKWSDIILRIDSSCIITVNKQLQKERIKGGVLHVVPFTKNDKERTVPVDNELLSLLQEHKSIQEFKKTVAGELWADNNLVFCDDIGGFLSPDAITKQFTRFIEKQGIPITKLHALRHTAATEMLQAGDSVKDVQHSLGHATAAFTLDRYVKIADEALQASALRREAHRQNRRAATHSAVL